LAPRTDLRHLVELFLREFATFLPRFKSSGPGGAREEGRPVRGRRGGPLTRGATDLARSDR